MTDERKGRLAGEAGATPDAETLGALLGDLVELRDYLVARGQHTYELAQRFMQNARRGGAERAYDERQATMLEYQNYIWHEIAGRVDQIIAHYGGASGSDEDTTPDTGNAQGDDLATKGGAE